MPEAAHKVHDHNVHIGAKLSPPAASEREINVLPEKRGETQVPAPPEIRYRSCPIRGIEIRRQIKAQHLRNSDCHVRISGEVKINLERVGKHDNQAVYI